MNQAVSSGVKSSIVGGKATVALGFGIVTVVTYYGYPGYSEVASATSDASAVVTHAPCAIV